MKHAWDRLRLSDTGRHRNIARRRWSDELRRFCDWPYREGVASPKNLAKSLKTLSLKKPSEKESVNAAKVLQLQTENFFRALEVETLRNNVANLIHAKKNAEQSLRLFHEEVRNLEQELGTPKTSGTLDYEISEGEWFDIIER